MTNPDPNPWARIGAEVRSRRLALRLTQKEAAQRAGISEPTWGLLEGGHQSGYKPLTVVGVCRALQWSPDSIERMLSGAEPVPVESGVPFDPSTMGPRELADVLEAAAVHLRGQAEDDSPRSQAH